MVLVFVVWFLVPFILMTDLYPLFRYGMFAEAIKPKQTTEMLQLWWRSTDSPAQYFEPTTIGLTENHFGYILRHYFYTHQTKQLFSQTHQIALKKMPKPPVFWQLKQLRISPEKTDTLIVAEWKPVNP